MTDQNKAKERTDVSRMGRFMALGLVFGGFLGLILDNLVLYSGGGMVLGLALGTALEKRRQN